MPAKSQKQANLMRAATGRFLTPEQSARAWGIEELDHWFAEHFPEGRVTEQERHDAIYNDKWPIRKYTVTEECRIDVLSGHAVIGIKPESK